MTGVLPRPEFYRGASHRDKLKNIKMIKKLFSSEKIDSLSFLSSVQFLSLSR
jgi:hypothetical protein